MLLSALPKSFTANMFALPHVYSDHFLFYEDLQEPYHCSEQTAGLGVLMAGKGECDYLVNGTRNRVRSNQFFLVNRQSRLAIDVAKKESAPALLFFHSRLPGLVQHSLGHTDEKLLEEINSEGLHDFAHLERMHIGPAFCNTIALLVALGSSCSSFASLKADIMIRNLFEQLLRENRTATNLSKKNIRHQTVNAH